MTTRYLVKIIIRDVAFY